MKCLQCAGAGKEFDLAHDGFDDLSPWIRCDACNGSGSVCEVCGKPVCDEEAFGVAANDELIFCSADCVESWEDARIESAYNPQ